MATCTPVREAPERRLRWHARGQPFLSLRGCRFAFRELADIPSASIGKPPRCNGASLIPRSECESDVSPFYCARHGTLVDYARGPRRSVGRGNVSVRPGKRKRLAYLLLLRNRLQDGAAASGAQPREGSFVRDPLELIPLGVRARVVIELLSAADTEPDPDEWFSDWIAGFHPEDDYFIKWAIMSWSEVRTWNYLEREQQRAIMRNLLQVLHDLRNPNEVDPPAAP